MPEKNELGRWYYIILYISRDFSFSREKLPLYKGLLHKTHKVEVKHKKKDLN